MQVLKHSDLVEVPWKNGGGTTRSIAKGMRADQVAWTLSRADVDQDGPFSDFKGLTRVLTVVSGGAMELITPNNTLQANLWEPVRFEGCLEIQSRLKNGPLTDLNLMFDPVHCKGNVATRQGALHQDIMRPEHGLLAFHVLSGEPMIDASHLATGDTAFFDATDAALALNKGDALLEIRVTYRRQSEAIKLCIANR